MVGYGFIPLIDSVIRFGKTRSVIARTEKSKLAFVLLPANSAIPAMGKTTPSDGVRPTGTKRRLPNTTAVDSVEQANKKLLSSNKYATLSSDGVQKKEKLPPFYVKGNSMNLVRDLNQLIAKGLQAELRLLTDGVKITVPSTPHYKSVTEYLDVVKAEYFTHDIASEKPLKVVLRGLPDMETSELMDTLKIANLQLVQIFKMRRHNQAVKYRDQLYLLHLVKGSTNLTELKSIRALGNVVVQWERYKPVHREVTQCGNCLNFGHGSKHCHMRSRCSKCGENHRSASCEVEAVVACLNCGQNHSSMSRTCPKRNEFINIRKTVAQRTRPKPKKEINIIGENFPELSLPSQTQRHPPPPVSPPGFRTYAEAANTPPSDAPYSMDQLALLFSELDKQTRACRTNDQQVAVMMRFYYQHRSILSSTA